MEAFVRKNADSWHGSGYLGHILAVAEYEIALRAVSGRAKQRRIAGIQARSWPIRIRE